MMEAVLVLLMGLAALAVMVGAGVAFTVWVAKKVWRA